MRDIALNSNGQPIFENGDYVWIYDAEVVAQQIYITLDSRLREFEPDTLLGLEQNNLFGKDTVQDFIEQDIHDAIIDQVSEVDSVDSIDLEFDSENRVMTASVACSSKSFGIIQREYDIDAQ